MSAELDTRIRELAQSQNETVNGFIENLLEEATQETAMVIQLDMNLIADLQRLAEAELRPIHNLVIYLLTRAVEKARKEGRL